MVKIRFPSKEPYVGLVRLLVSGLARQNNLDEESADDLKLAVNEVAARLTEHPNVRNIRISLSEDGGKLFVQINADGAVKSKLLFKDSLIKEETIGLLVDKLNIKEENGSTDISLITRTPTV